MFGIGRSKVSVTSALPAVQVSESVLPARKVLEHPKPVMLEAAMSDGERSAYNELAKEIGFRPASLIKDELLAFLQELHLPVYPYTEVYGYLNKSLGYGSSGWGQTWSWCPLRDLDCNQSDLEERDHRSGNGAFKMDRTYHGAVPFDVVDLVKKISKKIPDAHFFVSDTVKAIDRVGKDPFLGVSAIGMGEMIIIAEWDEPAFQLQQKQK